MSCETNFGQMFLEEILSAKLGIVILGFGKNARLTYLKMKDYGVESSVYAFCSDDSEYRGSSMYEKKIISSKEVLSNVENYIALVPNGGSSRKLEEKLRGLGFPEEKLVAVPDSFLDTCGAVLFPQKRESQLRKNLSEFEQKNCPICGCEDFSEEHDIRHCNVCGHGFRSRFHNEILPEYYEKSYWEHDKNRQVILSVQPSPEWKFWVDSRIKLLESFGVLNHADPSKIKVLEFGCAEGMLLYQLKQRGYQVTGNEIGEIAIEASKELGIEISRLPIEEFSKSDRKFDLIMSFHVLEHLRDPRRVMENLSEMLSPGGIMVMHVPVNDGEYDNMDHYHFFSHSSCIKLMEFFTTDVRSDYLDYRDSSGKVLAAGTYVGRKPL